MIGIDKPFDGERSRDRYFKDDELIAIWRAADAIGGSEGRFLKMLMLTGKRKGALAADALAGHRRTLVLETTAIGA